MHQLKDSDSNVVVLQSFSNHLMLKCPLYLFNTFKKTISYFETKTR